VHERLRAGPEARPLGGAFEGRAPPAQPGGTRSDPNREARPATPRALTPAPVRRDGWGLWTRPRRAGACRRRRAPRGGDDLLRGPRAPRAGSLYADGGPRGASAEG